MKCDICDDTGICEYRHGKPVWCRCDNVPRVPTKKELDEIDKEVADIAKPIWGKHDRELAQKKKGLTRKKK